MTVKPHLAWQYRDPATLIGRRCIAITRMDVTLDGTLDLIVESRPRGPEIPGHRPARHRLTYATTRTKPRRHPRCRHHGRQTMQTHRNHIACQEMASNQPMPILRHEKTRHRTLRPDRRSHDALHLDRQMPWMPNAIWITTPDDSIKTAIRGWNRYANGEWRKH